MAGSDIVTAVCIWRLLMKNKFGNFIYKLCLKFKKRENKGEIKLYTQRKIMGILKKLLIQNLKFNREQGITCAEQIYKSGGNFKNCLWTMGWPNLDLVKRW